LKLPFTSSKKEIKFPVQEAIKKIGRKIFEGYFNQVMNVPPNQNTADYLRAYGEIGWLFACVGRISQNVADSEWKAYKGEDVQTNSKALSVLKKPNPFMSQYELLEKTSMFLELRGKCFWYIAKDSLHRPKEIWCISPLDMWIIPDKDNFIKGYIYKAGAVQIPLTTDEVIFINYPDPLNPYNGIGPAQAAANSLETDKYSAQWNRNFFYNNADPSGIVSIPDVSDDEYDRVVAQWNDKYGGVDNAKRTAIVKGGTVTYTPIQISQKDMDFYNLRQMSRDEILGAFGIHKSILGITDDVNRSNAETAEYSFAKHVIRPRLRRIQDKINNELVPMFKEDGEIKFTDPVPENKDFIKQILDTQLNKTITINEGRKILNKILGSQLDDYPGGDVIFQTVSMQPLGTMLPVPIKPDAPSPPPPEESKKKVLTKQIRKKVARQVEKNNATRHADFLIMAAPLEKAFFNVIKEYMKNMQKEVVKKIEGGSHDPVDLEKWNKVLSEKTIDLYIKCFKVGGEAVISEFKAIGNYIHKDIGVEFDLKSPEVQKAIQRKIIKAQSINADTRQKIKDDIENAFTSEDGFSIKDIAQRIGSDEYPEFDESRCNTIAQTETMGSLNNATFESYSQNSHLIDGKAWLSAFENTRDSHLEAAQEYSEENPLPVDDYFQVGNGEGQYPLDDNLPVEEIVNCHCCMMPVVKV
jgi:HK97 family phage portal protein